ncbi:hypothetical protein QVD17_01578 [Tagetes erecta]|uniref:RING-CH-type domain-containing protein n=1 Tax=Tagetes erecta TaxID=13708 RepID=A0AAD8L555_TARER|nr:hypothetical protein QVD17_01578 [Tagetes erecta]
MNYIIPAIKSSQPLKAQKNYHILHDSNTLSDYQYQNKPKLTHHYSNVNFFLDFFKLIISSHPLFRTNHDLTFQRLFPNYSITSSKMEDHISLRVDQQVVLPTETKQDEGYDGFGEEEPLIQSIECRICQEEDIIKNLEAPCACSGSLKFAHRKCVQRWCDEKRDTICEICHQAYKPGYTAPPPQSDDTVIDISGNWTPDQQRPIESDYDEYEDNSASGASLCRSTALILMALLLLRHSFTIGDDDSDDDDPSIFFALFLLRAAGFLLPCYIMVWVISILQRRREAQEAETLVAADVPFMSQAEQHNVTIAPGPAIAPTPAFTPPIIPTHDTLQ